MRVIDITLKLLRLTDVLAAWRSAIDEADQRRRDRIARYADEIAQTISRLAVAYARLEARPGETAARHEAIRDLARLKGYVEGIAAVLEGRVDGRRVAGLQRRLEGLVLEGAVSDSLDQASPRSIERLLAAEGWFRALADGLRA
jgi:hypothetical protein